MTPIAETAGIATGDAAIVGPGRDCPRCPRLADFRAGNRARLPDYHNAPVPSFGPKDARLLIVGLAPGLHGANRTGRPFTGDYAGDLLYDTLLRYGFAEGAYRRDPADGLQLKGCMITNAVRCVPPENKPVGAEFSACRPFLAETIAALPRLQVIVALGTGSHASVVSALGQRQSALRFGHGALHRLDHGLTLADSYHCSRYNTNTGRLTEPMFHAVFARVRAIVDAGS
ncbi:MAG: uracil-DNA glycosylase [Alphaproteobacteria bacterium]